MKKMSSVIGIVSVDEFGHVSDDWLLARKIHYDQLEEVTISILTDYTFFLVLVSIYTWSNHSFNGEENAHRLIGNSNLISI